MISLKEYVKESERTSSDNIYMWNINPQTLHGIIGLVTEAGELMDNMKKVMFYDAPYDKENLEEELGDIMWYWALACRAEGFDPEEILMGNLEKLKKRYPEKFTTEDAMERKDKLMERY